MHRLKDVGTDTTENSPFVFSQLLVPFMILLIGLSFGSICLLVEMKLHKEKEKTTNVDEIHSFVQNLIQNLTL